MPSAKNLNELPTGSELRRLSKPSKKGETVSRLSTTRAIPKTHAIASVRLPKPAEHPYAMNEMNALTTKDITTSFIFFYPEGGPETRADLLSAANSGAASN